MRLYFANAAPLDFYVGEHLRTLAYSAANWKWRDISATRSDARQTIYRRPATFERVRQCVITRILRALIEVVDILSIFWWTVTW